MRESVIKLMELLKIEIKKIDEELEQELYKISKKQLKENKSIKSEILVEDAENPMYIKSIKDFQAMARVIIEQIQRKLDKKTNPEFVISYDFLNKLITRINLTSKEKFNIIFFNIDYNLRNDILNKNNIMINFNKLNNAKFKYTTPEEVKKIILDAPLENYEEIYDSILDENKKEEIKKYISKNLTNTSDKIKAHLNIKTHYFDKKDTFSKEDIEIIINNLKILLVPEDVLEEVKIVLIKQLEKRQNVKEVVESHEISLSDRIKALEQEKNALKQELSLVIDLRECILKEFLSFDELTRIVFILKKLNYDEQTIKNIIFANESKLYDRSIIDKYNYFIKKLEFFKESYGIIKTVEELNEDYEALVTSEDEDKKIYESILASDLEKVIKLVPSTYEYYLRNNK